jgi:hypothetical protein
MSIGSNLIRWVVVIVVSLNLILMIFEAFIKKNLTSGGFAHWIYSLSDAHRKFFRFID